MLNRYVHSTIFGTFVFNEQFKVLEKVMFSNSEQYNKREETEKKLEKKHNATTKLDEKTQSKILEHFRNSNYYKSFYDSNLESSKQELRKAGSDDILILQTISSIVGMDKTTNLLTKRLRDWYAWYNPEFNYNMDDNEKFVELITQGNDRKDSKSMGTPLSKENLQPIIRLAKEIHSLNLENNKLRDYLAGIMKKVCPNVEAITGPFIGAKLIEQSGSLKRLATFPSSTIQLLGAEKALFRHLKTGAKPPKYGLIHEHPLLADSKKSEQGKVARMLADKIAIAAKIDFFKGKFIGDKLYNEIKKKIQ